MTSVAAVLISLYSRDVVAEETIYFPHRDADYLQKSQHDGGAAFLPTGIVPNEPTPVVVFLHGTNSSGDLHVWLGGAHRDLRPTVQASISGDKTRPFIFAGPSQTRGATQPQHLWAKFDLAQFVDDLKRALGKRAMIDEEAIVLAGHSGAGCNPNGGLAGYTATGTQTVLALVAIDPCLDYELGTAFAKQTTNEPFWLLWQSMVWPREFESFRAALTRSPAKSRPIRIDRLVPSGSNPHEAIVPMAIQKVSEKFFPANEEQVVASEEAPNEAEEAKES